MSAEFSLSDVGRIEIKRDHRSINSRVSITVFDPDGEEIGEVHLWGRGNVTANVTSDFHIAITKQGE